MEKYQSGIYVLDGEKERELVVSIIPQRGDCLRDKHLPVLLKATVGGRTFEEDGYAGKAQKKASQFAVKVAESCSFDESAIDGYAQAMGLRVVKHA